MPGVPAAAIDQWQRLDQALTDIDYALPCVGPNHAWWTSDDPEEREAATNRCAPCPVIGLCAAYADAAREKFHVWASVDRGQRPAATDRSATTP